MILPEDGSLLGLEDGITLGEQLGFVEGTELGDKDGLDVGTVKIKYEHYSMLNLMRYRYSPAVHVDDTAPKFLVAMEVRHVQ